MSDPVRTLRSVPQGAAVAPGASGDRVMAVVLTCNAPAALERCLEALASQHRFPDRVVVVDNSTSVASVGAVPDALSVEWVRLPHNPGPAGGHAAGLRHFAGSDCDVAWVMDDDCAPSPECLARLLEAQEAAATPSLVLPAWVDTTTNVATFYPGWCGLLIPRRIVQTVGYPVEELFWWAEDTEYLHWRIPNAGFSTLRVPDAEVRHHRGRGSRRKPAWKYYYETRNSVYYRIRIQKGMKLRRLTRVLSRTVGRLVLYEDQRGRKALFFVRGLFDGLTGRLGKRVPVADADRPAAPVLS